MCPGIHRQLEGHGGSLWEMIERHEGQGQQGKMRKGEDGRAEDKVKKRGGGILIKSGLTSCVYPAVCGMCVGSQQDENSPVWQRLSPSQCAQGRDGVRGRV